MADASVNQTARFVFEKRLALPLASRQAIGELTPRAKCWLENRATAGLPALRDADDRVVVGEPDEFPTRREPNIQGAGTKSFVTQS
jgi:hypothetical protein